MLVVLLQRRRGEPRVVVDGVLRGAGVRQLPHLHVLVNYVIGELGFLEAGGRHALLAGGGRVGRVEARLDEPLAGVRRDHGLQLPRGERVHVARLRRDQ